MVLNNTSLHTARLTHVGPDTARLSIPTYAMKWRPGQHVFLRFPAVRGLESHPFTVASVGRVTNAKEVESMIGKKPRGQIVEMREMVFLIRAQAGFTRALVEHSLRTFRGDYAVLIDGPYGHNSATDLAAFDSVLMCIGGSGISWAVGVLQGIAAQPRRPATIRLVWAVRDQCKPTNTLPVLTLQLLSPGSTPSSLPSAPLSTLRSTSLEPLVQARRTTQARVTPRLTRRFPTSRLPPSLLSRRKCPRSSHRTMAAQA